MASVAPSMMLTLSAEGAPVCGVFAAYSLLLIGL
jgi:hypothetical protein